MNKLLIAIVAGIAAAALMWFLLLAADVVTDEAAGLSEPTFRVFQLKIAAALAFGGFFVGTAVKFLFDLWLDRIRAKQSKTLLATELLAEVRHYHREIRRLDHLFQMLSENAGLLDIPKLDLSKLFALPQTPVFDSSIGKLGLLGPELAGEMISLFSRLQAHQRQNERFLDMSSDSTANAIKMLEIFLGTTRNALMPPLEAVDGDLAKIAGAGPRLDESYGPRAPSQLEKSGVAEPPR